MPDRYAVIGHPIGHTLSPRIHAAFARTTGEDLVYGAIDGGADAGGFERAVQAFRSQGGRGLSVTLPFKLRALLLASQADDDARAAGAANTLKFEAGQIAARNTDGAGLVRDIEANLAVPLRGKRVLILGAGGATRGVILPIARAGAHHILVANRTREKARQLARELQSHLAGVPLESAGLEELAALGAWDIIVNATSAGLGGDAPALPSSAFGACELAYEMVYGRGLTPFLQLARSAGAARLADGIGMLVEQAAEQFAWWRGVRPDTAAIRTELALPLG